MKFTRSIIKALFVASLAAQPLFGGLVSSTPSRKDFAKGEEKLTVYTNVPGHEKPIINNHRSRAKSDIFEVWVRSAATDNEWVQCFAHMVYNRMLEMPDVKEFSRPTAAYGYQRNTAGYTHTYVNFEMSENSVVEVAVRKIGETLLNHKVGIEKSAVHPVQKMVPGSKKDANGRVYFKITKPGQLFVDTNGQMDDHHASIPEDQPWGRMKGNPPVHSIGIYANPMMDKPPGPGEGVKILNAGETPPREADDSYKTFVFGPGVHHIGYAYPLHPGKTYHIPGDAILYGNIVNNDAVAGAYRSQGDSIKILGYGVLNALVVAHNTTGFKSPEYAVFNAQFKAYNDKRVLAGLKPFESTTALELHGLWDFTLKGLTIADPPSFNTRINGAGKPNDKSLVSWIKCHSWRVTGDGFGSYYPLEDSFLRTSDDSSYVRNTRKRISTWKDTNANVFKCIGNSTGTVEDSDIIYARWRNPMANGGIISLASYGGSPPGFSKSAGLAFRDIRIHDRLISSGGIVNSGSQVTYMNVFFENMNLFTQFNKRKCLLLGSKEAPYTGKVLFKNITFRDPLVEGSKPVKLTQENYKDYFEVNEFVDKSVFEPAAP